jgi:hypothetical protein
MANKFEEISVKNECEIIRFIIIFVYVSYIYFRVSLIHALGLVFRRMHF